MKKQFLIVLAFLFMAGGCHRVADAQGRYLKAKENLKKTKTSYEAFCALNSAAKEAFNAGKKEDARMYANQLNHLMEKYTTDWNYGNAVQDVNIVLGRIALTEGQTEAAKAHLLKAGDSPGSPQMNSFGPNMTLARDLLEKGERQVVLEYFTRCAKFWKMGGDQLLAWRKQVEAGQIPDFGPNLLY